MKDPAFAMAKEILRVADELEGHPGLIRKIDTDTGNHVFVTNRDGKRIFRVATFKPVTLERA